jgi:hypothetical protein
LRLQPPKGAPFKRGRLKVTVFLKGGYYILMIYIICFGATFRVKGTQGDLHIVPRGTKLHYAVFKGLREHIKISKKLKFCQILTKKSLKWKIMQN